MRLRDLTTPFKALGPEESPVLSRSIWELIAAVRANPYTHFEDIDVVAGSAGQPFPVRLRTLNIVPTGYVVIGINVPGVVYTAPLTAETKWRVNVLFLSCSVAGAQMTLRVT